MTLEELQAKLREMGIPHDEWNPAGGKSVQLPRLEKYKELLLQLRSLLESQVEKDKAQLADLHAMLQRTKHGGGA